MVTGDEATTEVKNEWSITSTPLINLHGVVIKGECKVSRHEEVTGE
jgi:hypothetical protein